jgi:hypothetical protein
MSTADDYRRAYGGISDEQLRAVRPVDHDPGAWAAWSAELRRRGLADGASGAPGRAAAGAGQCELDGTAYAPLDEYPDEETALMAKAMLESAGIPAYFAYNGGLHLEPQYYWARGTHDWFWMGGAAYVLAVPSDRVELARSALSSEVSDAELEEQALDAAPPDDAGPQAG